MKLLKLIGILLVIPALAFGVAMYYEITWDTQIQTSLANEYPDVSQDKIKTITLEYLIFNPDISKGMEFGFDEYAFLVLKYGALASLALGLLIVGFVIVASRITRNDRDLLASVFNPTITVSVVLVSLQTVMNGLLLVGALYYGESAAIGRVHFVIIGLVGIGAVIGTLGMITSLFKALEPPEIIINEELLDKEDKVYRLVEEVAEKSGCRIPDHVVLGAKPVFFAFEGKIRTSGGVMDGQVLYLSKYLSRYLKDEELKGVIAHEFGHFVGKDLVYTRKFHFSYNALGQSLERLQDAEGFSMVVARIPALFLLRYILESFALQERKNSREREYEADRYAIGMYGKETFLSGLMKVIALDDLFSRAIDVVRSSELDHEDDVAVEKAIHESMQNLIPTELPGIRKNMPEQKLAHPFDTHPTMSERCLNAGVEPESLVENLALA